uniref:RYYR-CCHC domain-containing protein n=1 Tax=Parascaris univalens TaxID=6257 RepID=A0A915BVJ4_PARUN
MSDEEDFGVAVRARSRAKVHPILSFPSRECRGRIIEFEFAGRGRDYVTEYYRCSKCFRLKRQNPKLDPVPRVTVINGRFKTDPEHPQHAHYCQLDTIGEAAGKRDGYLHLSTLFIDEIESEGVVAAERGIEENKISMNECDSKGRATHVPMKSDKVTDMIASKIESDLHETFRGTMLRRSSRKRTHMDYNVGENNCADISANDRSTRKRSKKPSTHSEHRIANELTNNFSDTFVRLDDAKKRIFNVMLPDESEQTATVRLVSEFCPKDVFNCRSRCQYELCGGCVHMFACSCWSSTSNAGVLCRHCHAALPWARAFLKISSVDVGDEGIRAEDVMMDGTENEQEVNDMPIADEGLASQHPANGGHVGEMASDANGYRWVQEGSGDEVCVSPVDKDFRFTTSSSGPFAASGTGNSIRTSNGGMCMQGTKTIPVRVGGDDVTCRIVAEQVDDALPTYYVEDFGQARSQLIQALQDKRIIELSEAVQRELADKFNELSNILRSHIDQVRKRRREATFVGIHGRSSPATNHAQNRPSYGMANVNTAFSVRQLSHNRTRQAREDFVYASVTELDTVGERSARMVRESEFTQPPPRMTREAEIVRRLRSTTVESRIVERLRAAKVSTGICASHKVVSSAVSESNDRPSIPMTEPREFVCSEIKEECVRMEVAHQEDQAQRERRVESGKENSPVDSNNGITDAAISRSASESNVLASTSVGEERDDRQATGSSNGQHNSIPYALDTDGVQKAANSEGSVLTSTAVSHNPGRNGLQAIIKTETLENVETSVKGMTVQPCSSLDQKTSLPISDARQRLGLLNGEQVDKCIGMLDASSERLSRTNVVGCSSVTPGCDVISERISLVTCSLGSIGCTGEAYLTTVWEKRRNKAYKRIRCKKCKRFRSVSHTIPDEEMLHERPIDIERTC